MLGVAAAGQRCGRRSDTRSLDRIHGPQPCTDDRLSLFAGFPGWRGVCRGRKNTPPASSSRMLLSLARKSIGHAEQEDAAQHTHAVLEFSNRWRGGTSGAPRSASIITATEE